MSSDGSLSEDWRAGPWGPPKRSTAIYRGQLVRVVEGRVIRLDPVGAPTQARTKGQARIELPGGDVRIVSDEELS